MDDDILGRPAGLPADQQFLLAEHPRDTWSAGRIKNLGRTWLHMHGSFRDTAARLMDSINAVREAGAFNPGFAPRFAHEASGLLGHLNAHHNIEDDHYFPIFRQAEPRLIRGFDIMDADHHVIHDAIESFASEGNGFLHKIGRAEGMPDDAQKYALDAMGDELARFRRLLVQHLDDEEDLVIPLIVERDDLG
ncbi:MAG: hemerythrin domain-containing protein [Paracoccus sp. (in: a-proteobacteria)]|nr:hemerythrin domain-containing protein [Paracoccus sp. (in: a-proteobacteria)]